ncbi:MAG TPA: hypothetical protein VIM31_02885 [Candidatus Microsaccharimonas sp.]|jgi:hypothetical protein
MAKKYTKQQHEKHQKRHRIIVGLSIVVVAVLLGLIFSFIIIPKVINDTRLNRINHIFSSIQGPALVYDETDHIFGDKRLYEWDASRSYASSKTLVVGKTVTDAFDLFDKAIVAAGYTPVQDAHPNSVVKERTYKTPRGEYVYLDAVSKLRTDAFQNQVWMGSTENNFRNIDPNAGPASVTLRVNLDDNNE